MSKSLFFEFMERLLEFPLWIKQIIFLNLYEVLSIIGSKYVIILIKLD